MTTSNAGALRPRLAALAALVPRGACVADVGSDHGLLPLALLASGAVRRAVATERTEGQAARIRRPPPGAAWADRWSIRSGDGLAPLSREDGVDTIVLAGIGGRTMARILDPGDLARLAPRALVLQPRTEAAAVRARLSELRFVPVAETLVHDRGRLYLSIRAAPGDDGDVYRDAVLSREDLLHAGPLLVRDRPAEAVTAWRLERKRLEGLARAGRGRAAALARADRILARLAEG